MEKTYPCVSHNFEFYPAILGNWHVFFDLSEGAQDFSCLQDEKAFKDMQVLDLDQCVSLVHHQPMEKLHVHEKQVQVQANCEDDPIGHDNLYGLDW